MRHVVLPLDQGGVTMSTLCDAQVSLFRGATDARPVWTVIIGAVLDDIQAGTHRQAIERLRDLRTTQGQAAYNAAKQYLVAVTLGGTFAPKRSKTTLVQHSGLVHGDIDHLADAQAMKAVLCADASTAYCFVSPSGDGLKLGVPIAPVADDAVYKHAWQTVANYYQQHYGVTWDPSEKDICRLCFVSWDPDCYVNPDAQLFPVPLAPAVQGPRQQTPPFPRLVVSGDRCDWYARQALDTAVKMIDASPPGNRHQARTRAAYLLGGYVAGGLLTRDEALDALEAAVQRNTAHLQPSLKTIEACLEAGMQEAITLEELEQERRQWVATNWHKRARPWTGKLATIPTEEVRPWH